MTMAIDREKIYQSLPVFMQNMAVTFEGMRLYRRRYDERYRVISEGVSSRTFMDAALLRGFQEQRLRTQFAVAQHSPFWKERFHEFGVSPDSTDVFAELAKLPVLRKDEVKANVAGIALPDPSGERTISSHTSGTTGSGLIFPVTHDAELEQWAIWWRYRSWHDISPVTWCGYFGGRSLVAPNQNKAPYWRINRCGRQLMFSAYHLKPDTAIDYLGALATHPVPWLHGYPSILAILAGFIIDQGLAPPQIRIITAGAESLLSQQRTIIERGFGAPVVQHYGQAEGVANFSECEFSRLHVDEDYSLVEFVAVPNESGLFRIVGTNWSNSSFPLFRYDTGDLATLSDEKCRCGRLGRIVLQVDGRKEDCILLPGGAKVGRLDHIFKDLVHVREAQIYQSEPERVILRVVKGAGYDKAGQERLLLTEARKRLGDAIGISLEYREKLQRTRTGKLRFVVNELDELRSRYETDSPEP